LDLISARIPHI